MPSKLTILFVPLDGYGHINACVGVAERMLAHGHRVIFALERAWAGKASRYPGIEEVHFVDPTRDPKLGANEYWIEFMQEFKAAFPLEPLEAVKQANVELEEQFLYTLLNVDEQLVDIIGKLKPNVIVADTYVSIPAVHKSGIPWVWLTSATPLTCLPSDDLPPHRSGYSINSDRKQWKIYAETEEKVFGGIGEKFAKELETKYGMPPLESGKVIHPSPYLNVYAYPEELDYLDIRPLPPTWQRFDHFIRFSESDPDFSIPKEFLDCPLGSLVYVSMGSMGCSDVDLMSRLVSILSNSPNRFIFSLGPSMGKVKLADNMWGAAFLPQTNVLQLVSLVITHGGNNTFIETLYYGKPMLVTPLFGDQRDNAQRVTELGYGDRLNPYTCEPEEMLAKVSRLLSDAELHAKVAKLSRRLQQSNSTEKAALAMEALAK